MLFLEPQAKVFLIVHLVVGAALVGSATHVVVWTRGYWRGRCTRHAAVRRFARITAVLFAASFILGNLIYPVYKVRVRSEYFEDAAAQRADRALRTAAQTPGSATPHADLGFPRWGQALTRLFDVKEHLAALGLALSIACAAIVGAWTPQRDGTAIAPIVAGLALAVATCAWVPAIVGALVTSYRSI